ncbi:hypothetical protein ACI65C_002584 [Semiaphis heraclei]
MLQDTSEERIQTYKEAKNLANSILRCQKRLAEMKAIEDIENYKANPRLFYKHCKSVKEGYKARNCTMSDNDGNLVTESQVITNLFKEHFEQLLNNSQELSLGDKHSSSFRPSIQYCLNNFNWVGDFLIKPSSALKRCKWQLTRKANG